MNKPAHFNVIATDAHSYLVASVCTNYGVMHDENFLVLVREKQPSKFCRRSILKAIKGKAIKTYADIKNLSKGTIHECWGDDMYL